MKFTKISIIKIINCYRTPNPEGTTKFSKECPIFFLFLSATYMYNVPGMFNY